MRYDQVTMAPPLTKVTRFIIITCVVVYFGAFFFRGMTIGGLTLTDIFGLSPKAVVKDFWLWQFVTYIFFHGPPLHLLLNMLILWYFGSEIEMRMGEKRYLIFFLICGVGAGVCNIAMNVLMNPDVSQLTRPVVGSSGAVYGILAAYGLFFRDRYMLIFFLFPIKAMYFAVVMFGLELAMGLNGGDNIAHFAHLGGLAVGAAYVWWYYFRSGGGSGRSRRDAEKEKLKRQFTLIVNESVEKSKENNGPYWN